MKKLAILILTSWIVGACAPTPQPIELGTDACAHCMMTIVEEPFAAEVVTQKGKVFKFDAIECMVAYVKGEDEGQYAFLLVRDFNRPAEWQDARTASYLVSEELPSPMGAYLSAYQDEMGAIGMREAKGGEVYDWGQLKKFFMNIGR